MATTTSNSADFIEDDIVDGLPDPGRLGVALLLVRLALGLPLAYHGAQIALGLFQGPGLAGFVKFTHMPFPVAALVGYGELLGGLGVLAGVATRLAATGTGIIMLGAIFLVHIKNGYSLANQGYEYALALTLLSIALILVGGGPYALGTIFQRSRANTSPATD